MTLHNAPHERVSDPLGAFEVEEVAVFGDRAINRWRYRFGEGDDHSVRGVTLIKVRGNKIVVVWSSFGRTDGRSLAVLAQIALRRNRRIGQRFHEKGTATMKLTTAGFRPVSRITQLRKSHA